MKILVYGAGVIGSYLSHILLCARHDVTILARGNRMNEIEKNGLQIRHFLQRKTTCDKIKVTREFLPEDAYDIVFVVMQYTQMKEVLANIADNEKCDLFVLVGNNPTAIQMQEYIKQKSKNKKDLVFAFQSVGGRREGEKVISIHAQRASSLTVGTLDGSDGYKDTLNKVFEKTQLTLEHHEDINAMLVSHIAFILPLVFACYIYNGNLRLAFKKADTRYKVIKAINEGFSVVESNGLTATPISQVELVRYKPKRTSLLLKIVAYTPLGRLAISDHAMTAKDEMHALAAEFQKQRNQSSVKTPNWIDLEQRSVSAD